MPWYDLVMMHVVEILVTMHVMEIFTVIEEVVPMVKMLMLLVVRAVMVIVLVQYGHSFEQVDPAIYKNKMK